MSSETFTTQVYRCDSSRITIELSGLARTAFRAGERAIYSEHGVATVLIGPLQ